MHLHVSWKSYSRASRGGRDPLRGDDVHLMSELKLLTQAFIAGCALAVQEKAWILSYTLLLLFLMWNAQTSISQQLSPVDARCLRFYTNKKREGKNSLLNLTTACPMLRSPWYSRLIRTIALFRTSWPCWYRLRQCFFRCSWCSNGSDV